MRHTEVVQEIYAAFGRGDVAAILDKLDEGVEWEYGASPDGVPWLQPRRGKAGAAEFFLSLGELDIQKFVPKALLEGNGLVVALVDIEAVVKKTGRKFVEEDEVHLWHFDAAGRVVRFRHRADTHQQIEAWRG
jgi:ketosteroid isomerase-like protein